MVTPHFHPEVGGLETSVRLLGGWLAERGHSVTIHTSALTTHREVLPPKDEIDGLTILRYPLRLNLGYFRAVFRPELGEPDAIHLHGYAVLTNDLVARRARAPTVYSLHHGVSMPHPTLGTRVERRLYDSLVGIPTLRRVQAIVAANRPDVAWLASHRAGAEKAVVLPTPLPEEAFEPGDAARARGRFGDARFAMYLGRLHPEKGVLRLVEALSKVPVLEAWFAGPEAGAGRDLIEKAQGLGIESRVRLLGVVSEETKRDLLAASEFLVLPSVYEAQGLAVAEAWAQAKAVVVSRVGALSTRIEDGHTGLLVPAGDATALARAMARLLEDPAAARAMGRRGAAEAERLRISRIGPEFEALYERLLDRTG